MSRRLSVPRRGEWALVTGASSGIGAEFARQLARRGWNLILVARRIELLDSLARELPGDIEVRTVKADLCIREGVGSTMSFCREHHIQPAMLINNAGFGYHGDIADQAPENAAGMIDLNIKALTHLSIWAAQGMKRRRHGVIMNISSVASFQPCPYVGTYGATKAFVTSFTEALAEELRRHNVHAIAVCPGVTESEFHAKAGPPYRLQKHMKFATARDCVRRSLESLDQRRVIHVDGSKNKVIVFIQRFVPRAVVRRVGGWLMKSEH